MEIETDKRKNPPAQNAEKPRHFINTAAFDVVGTVASLGAGVMSAWYAAMRNFNNRTLKTTGIVKHLESKRDSAMSLLYKDNAPKDALTEMKKIQEEYHTAKNALLKERGLGTPFKKWQALDKFGKGEALFTFAAVTAVTLGTMAGLGYSRSTSQKQEELESRLNALDSTLQR